MGQQASKRPVKQKNWKDQAKIQGLYEMYTESIRLSRLIESQSVTGQHSISQGKKPLPHKSQTKKPKSRKGSHNNSNTKRNSQQERKFLQQLLQSFKMREEFIWGEEIPDLFKKHFSEQFEEKWQQSKEFFYQLLVENVGVDVGGEVGTSRIGMSRGSTSDRQGFKKFPIPATSNISYGHISLPKTTDTRKINSFQQYFHQVIIKHRDSMTIKSSVLHNDDQIDRRKQEQIAQVESQRMTLEEEINFINSSIIDQEEEGNREGKSERFEQNNSNNNNRLNNNNMDSQPIHQTDDDQYFLPLITKRHKHRQSNKRNKYRDLVERISHYSQQSQSVEHQIEMSHFPSAVKYSKVRLQSASVILPSTIFYQRMNFSTKVQTDQSLKIYRQLSNTIQQTINSCNLISCPLKHFLLYFEYKTSKKKINQSHHHNETHSSVYMNGSKVNSHNNTSQANSDIEHHHQPSTYESVSGQLYEILIQVSQKSEFIRKKRQFNTNYLLKQVKDFTQAYTEFLYKYLNFNKIQQTDLSTFINLDTVYGIVLRNIWSIVNWIAERGYQWEEYALVEVVDQENPYFQVFTEVQIEDNPSVILRKYATFCNKNVKKMKIDPVKLCKAYKALLKLKNQVFPQKYLKKIIIFYRQATKCCQGADDLMTLYQFLLKNCILSNFAQQMHIFRMKNIIDKLIPIEQSSIDGAGEIVYAWTTWNIMLEMLSIKLKEYKKVLLVENESKVRVNGSRSNGKNKTHMTERKKPNSGMNKKRNLNNHSIQSSAQLLKHANQLNPERITDRKLQFTPVSSDQTHQ